MATEGEIRAAAEHVIENADEDTSACIVARAWLQRHGVVAMADTTDRWAAEACVRVQAALAMKAKLVAEDYPLNPTDCFFDDVGLVVSHYDRLAAENAALRQRVEERTEACIRIALAEQIGWDDTSVEFAIDRIVKKIRALDAPNGS